MKLFDKLKKLLGLQAIQDGCNNGTVSDGNSTPEILSVWEDDYLMVELLPVENLDYIIQEAKRVEDHARAHFDGNGYTSITVLEEPSFPLADKQILLDDMLQLMNDTGLQRLERLCFDGVAVEPKRMPVCFGCGEYGLFFSNKNNIVTHIWVAGHRFTTDRGKFEDALRKISAKYRLVVVNWFVGRAYDIGKYNEMQKFLNWEY